MSLVVNFSLFLVLIFTLNFFRNHIAHFLQRISLLFFRTPVPGVIFYSIFFLIGVTIHELSHLLTAEILGVRTGRIRIFPEEIKSGNMRLGSVESVAADPFREALIGAAPFLLGLTLITLIVSTQFGYLSSLDFNLWFTSLTPVKVFLLYLLFSITNTMYVSKEDQRAWWILPIVFVLIGATIYVFNIAFTQIFPVIVSYLKIINFALFVCLLLDLIVICALWFGQRVGETFTGTRVVYKQNSQ